MMKKWNSFFTITCETDFMIAWRLLQVNLLMLSVLIVEYASVVWGTR